jgi:hypothetical protein
VDIAGDFHNGLLKGRVNLADQKDVDKKEQQGTENEQDPPGDR